MNPLTARMSDVPPASRPHLRSPWSCNVQSTHTTSTPCASISPPPISDASGPSIRPESPILPPHLSAGAQAEDPPLFARHLLTSLLLGASVLFTLVPGATALAAQVPTTPQMTATSAQTTQRMSAVPSSQANAPLDEALTWKSEAPPTWRTFGHRDDGGAWFDELGRWCDTQTHVTADQAASMPVPEREALAYAANIPVSALRLGDPSLVEVESAIGTVTHPDSLDTGRGLLTSQPQREETFGHTRVRGQLFEGRTWADSKTLVTADQAAAMPLTQRTALAASAGVNVKDLHIGDASRALIDEKALIAAGRFDALAASFPNRMVTFDGFRMTAKTAAHFQKLLQKVGQHFPGRGVRITSTTGGRHVDPRHRQGKAIDFVVEPLSKKESITLDRLASSVGFDSFNEYLHHSPYKTGAHMHISLD